MKSLSVVIVGGGVAGLALANALAVRGINSTVLEKTKSPGEIDRGDVIHQSILDILEKWQIAHLLKKYDALEFTDFRILNHKGIEVFHFDLAKELDSRAAFTVLRHPDIERMLEEAATSTGRVTIMRNTPCIELMTKGSRVIGVVTPINKIPASLTIFATGLRSSLRDKYFGEKMLYHYPVAFYNARFKLVPEYSDTGIYVLGKHGVMIMVPLPHQEMRIGIQFSKRDNSEFISPKNIKDVICERLENFPIDSLEFIDAHVYKVTKSLNRSFWIPGAALIGDAAHTVHPAGGQGMNLAFQDAEALAQCLEESRATDSNPKLVDKSCAIYSYRRRKQIKNVLRRTHLMGMMSLLKSPVFISTREQLLMLADRIPSLKRLVFRRIVSVS